MNRWPFRHGAALGMGIMVLLAIAAVVYLQSRADDALPMGFVGEGLYLYDDYCASCHGWDGLGTGDGPPLVGDQAPERSRDELAGLMDHSESGLLELTDQEKADIIAYLRDIEAYGL